MSDILLCYPLPSSTSPQKNPALSIFYPGAALETAGHRVDYWDERYDDRQSLDGKIRRAQYVGVSSKTGEQLKGAKRVLQLAKASSKTTIFGGIHPSLLPDQCIREPFVDYIVVGEGEKSIVELIDALENKSDPGPGIMTRDGFTGPQTPLEGCDIPSPITSKTRPYFEKSYPADVMLSSSRGCPYKCGFCYNVAFHKSKYRPIPLERWEEDLDRLPGTRWLQMGEDWVGPRQRVMEIAEILHRRNIGWSPSLRADQIDRALAVDLAQRGCTGVSIGIESGSPPVLQHIINKMETVEDYLRAAEALSHANLKPQYYFIVGFPGETRSDQKETFDFADRLYKTHRGQVTFVFYSFTPLPGTPLYDKAVEAGCEMPAGMDAWSRYSLNRSFSEEYASIYHIAGFTFHKSRGDKTDRNFPGMRRWLIKPFEVLCTWRWKLRFWRFFRLEKFCIEKLLNWAARNK